MSHFEDLDLKNAGGIASGESNEARLIRPLAAREEGAASAMLARAFRDNPLNCSLIGANSTHRMRANRAGMRASLEATRNRGTRLVCSEASGPGAGIAGALIGFAPGDYPAPMPSILAQLRCLFIQGPRVANRWAEVFRQLDAIHPSEPHAYLGILGVSVARQGSGVGSRLLAAWLNGVDAAGSPGYLETDKEANLVFYQRVGFEVVDSVTIFGARVWCMRREARTQPR